MTGSSWVDIEAILDHQVSDTTLRSRRDEWIASGVFEQLEDETLAAYDRIIGLDMDNLSIDGSLRRAPAGGEGTGPNPTDRGKCGWKWSVAAEGHGLRLLHPTLDAVEATGLHHDIGMLHLDRGYDYPKTRAELAARGLTELDIQKRGTKPPPGTPHQLTLSLRWVVEAANSWWSNYGQLRRSTDRRKHHRHAALCLATTVLVVGRLIDWRNRWDPK